MKIERKLQDIPRREIDALENLLDKMLKSEGHFDYSAEELVDKEWKPVAGIKFAYSQGKTKEAVTLLAEGANRKGDFEVQLILNLQDETYALLMQSLEKQAPILTKSLPKTPSYSSS